MIILITVITLVVALCVWGVVSVRNYLYNANIADIPLVSWFLGGKKQDLGVTYTEQDATNFLTKIAVTVDMPCPTGVTCSTTAATYSGTKKVDTTLTNAEGTALINKWISVSKNAPFTSAQMRVNNDGSVDFIGQVSQARLENFIIAGKVQQETVTQIKPYIGALGDTFSVSAHGTLSIKNNQVDANFASVSVGILPVPPQIGKQYKAEIDSFVEERLKVVKGLSIEELTFSEGKTTFKGTVPEKIYFNKQ